jgi:flagellar basal-body rod protein FlgB
VGGTLVARSKLDGAGRPSAACQANKARVMFESVFQSTTIPILQQVVEFGQARQLVLAGNIANLDTPGYRTRDLSVEDFQSRLREAIEERHRPASMSPGERAFSLSGLGYPNETLSQRDDPVAEVAKDSKTILYHDDSNVASNTRSRKWSRTKCGIIWRFRS